MQLRPYARRQLHNTCDDICELIWDDGQNEEKQYGRINDSLPG
jgi:hypothetical protein